MPRQRKEETPCELTAVVVRGAKVRIVPWEYSPAWISDGFEVYGAAVTREGVAHLRVMAERRF